MLVCGCCHLNQYHHQLLLGIPSRNDVSFVCVSFATFVFNCCRLMDNPHSCMFKVHLINTTSFSFVSTSLSPIFLDLVFLFKWSKNELQKMFHDTLAFLKEHLPLSTSSITTSNCSFIHMPFLLVVGIQFIYGGFFLIYDSWIRGRISLSITCWSSMPLPHLRSTFKFMIVDVFKIPTSRNSMECI